MVRTLFLLSSRNNPDECANELYPANSIPYTPVQTPASDVFRFVISGYVHDIGIELYEHILIETQQYARII